MRIGHVSTFWPKRCAFPAYTESLILGMRAHRPDTHVVLAERPADAAETASWRCVPTFHRGEDYVDAIVARAVEERLDVVEVQYANDVLGDDERFPRLVAALDRAGIAAVVNNHSVYPERRRTRLRDAATFDRAVAERAAALVVHTPRMRDMLVARGIGADKVHVFPHGTKAVTLPAQGGARARLGLPPDAKIVLFFGFIWSGKGLDFLLTAFARLVRRVPEALLYVGGYTRRKWLPGEIYMAYLKSRARLLGIAPRTVWYGDFVPEHAVDDVYAASDVVALPYKQDYASSSAVVHQAAGMERVPFCSRIFKFDEVGDGISPELVADLDPEAWAKGLERLLRDEPFAADIRRRVARFRDETAWARIGARRLALFDSLVASSAPALRARAASAPE